MNKVEAVSKSLFFRWSEKLLSLLEEDGNFNCPACDFKHGRSADAVYPFMYMYSITKNIKWKNASLSLLDWSEENVSLKNGAYKNDITSEWTGTTVFTVIALLDTLSDFGSFFLALERNLLEKRVRKALDYLATFDDLKDRNINYPIANSLALYLGYLYFKEEKYKAKSYDFVSSYTNAVTKNNLLYGEGRPREERTEKNIAPVDIGYNAEESIPSMLRLALLSGNKNLYSLALRLSYGILPFMLADGGIDNSFGTRSFKWTYYGSRTSDGLCTAFLMLSKEDPVFGQVALKNLEAQKRATNDDLLSGGPGYKMAGSQSCVHHSFTHLKVISFILFHKLYENYRETEIRLPRYADYPPFYYDEIGVILSSSEGLSLSVSLNDWIYIPEGHPSGGTIGILHHEKAGVILISSMNEYVMKEKNNMQKKPLSLRHENLSTRVEKDGFSSVYDFKAGFSILDNCIKVDGCMKDKNAKEGDNYSFSYLLRDGKLEITVRADLGVFILPLVIYEGDEIIRDENGITIKRGSYQIEIRGKNFSFPYGDELIFNLIPGFMALKTEIRIDKEIKLEIEVKENEQNQKTF